MKLVVGLRATCVGLKVAVGNRVASFKCRS